MKESTMSSPPLSAGGTVHHQQRSLFLAPRAASSAPELSGARSSAFDCVSNDFSMMRSTTGYFYHSNRTFVPSQHAKQASFTELDLLEKVSVMTLLDESSICHTPLEQQIYHRHGACFFTPRTEKCIFSTKSKRKIYPDTPPQLSMQISLKSRNKNEFTPSSKRTRTRSGSFSKLQGNAPRLPLSSDLASCDNDLEIEHRQTYLPPCFSPGIVTIGTVPRPWKQQQLLQPVLYSELPDASREDEVSSTERIAAIKFPPPMPLMATPESKQSRTFTHGALKMRRKEEVSPLLYLP